MSNALRIAPAKPNCKSKSDSVAIPTPRDVPDGMKPFVAAVTSLLGKREGQFRNAQDSRVITVSDLKEAGLYDSKTNRIDLSGKTDTTPPSAPTNIHVQEFSRFNRVRWTNPTDDDLSHIEIWTHKTDGTPSFDEALLTGLVSAPHEYYDHLGLKPGEKAAYWLRAVDTSDNKSSFNPEPSSDVTITGTVDKASWEEEMYNLFFGDLTNNDGIKAIRKQINVETIQYDETRNYYNQDITLYGGSIYQAIHDNFVDEDTGKNIAPGNPHYWERHDDVMSILVDTGVRVVETEESITTIVQDMKNQDGTIAALNSKIKQNAESIELKVSRDEFSTLRDDHDELITNIDEKKGEIQVLSDKIVSQVFEGEYILGNGQSYTIASAVEQLANRYTVKIQENNNGVKAATGFSLGMDAAGVGEFIIMADKFKVVSQETIPKGVFAVDSTYGVYINGDLFLPGTLHGNVIEANTITAQEIAANAITADELSANAVTADHIAANAILAQHILAGQVSAGHLAANAVTADKIAANAIEGRHIKADVIDGKVLMQNSIPVDKLFSGVVWEFRMNQGYGNPDGATLTLEKPGARLFLIYGTTSSRETLQMTVQGSRIQHLTQTSLDGRDTFFFLDCIPRMDLVSTTARLVCASANMSPGASISSWMMIGITFKDTKADS